MEFVRRFGDPYDFEEDEQLRLIASDLSYEDFCKYYQADETVTKERFEEALKEPEDCVFIVSNETDVSFIGPWNTCVYELGKDGEFKELSN